MEVDKKVLSELRVVDLKRELEKRGLDKNGVKAVLMDRLSKALQEEGLSPDTHLFEFSDGKTTPKGDDLLHADLDKSMNGTEEGSAGDAPTQEALGAEDDAETTNENESEAIESNDVESSDLQEPPAPVISSVEEESTEMTDEPQGDAQDHDDQDDAMITLSEVDESLLLGQDDEEEQSAQGGEDEAEAMEQNEVEESSNLEETVNEECEGAELVNEVEGPDGDVETEQKESDEAPVTADSQEVLEATEGAEETKEDPSQEEAVTDATGEAGEGGEQPVGEAEGGADGAAPAEGAVEGDPEKDQQSSADGGKKKDGKPGAGANLWVSNLSSTTKATDLKRLFSRHGKLVGAKIVTSARTPGARCYGYVTMANQDDADRCIRFLHRVELHSRLISVERAKDDATGPLRNRTHSREPRPPPARGIQADGNKERERERKSKSRSQAASAAGPPHRRSPKPDVLSFAKIKEERERQRNREQERRQRELAKARRDQEEELRIRERERRQRLEADRLDKEKQRLRQEREKLEREKAELLRLERDRQRLERERLEREKEEIRNRKKRLEERPPPRPPAKRPAEDKRADYGGKRAVLDKDDLLLEPPPPPRFNETDRQRDRPRRDDKRPAPRRDDYRHTSPQRDSHTRSRRDKPDGAREARPAGRYDSSKSKHTSSQSHDKAWSSNGSQYKTYGTSSSGSGYNREVWAGTRQDWAQPSDSSSRWPAETDALGGRSYPSTAYGGTPYSAQPSPPGVVPTRYVVPRFDTYAHSLPVRKY